MSLSAPLTALALIAVALWIARKIESFGEPGGIE
jgi:hypothetical protein